MQKQNIILENVRQAKKKNKIKEVECKIKLARQQTEKLIETQKERQRRRRKPVFAHQQQQQQHHTTTTQMRGNFVWTFLYFKFTFNDLVVVAVAAAAMTTTTTTSAEQKSKWWTAACDVDIALPRYVGDDDDDDDVAAAFNAIVTMLNALPTHTHTCICIHTHRYKCSDKRSVADNKKKLQVCVVCAFVCVYLGPLLLWRALQC